MEIYTIGHSTRTINEFIDVLKSFGIKKVIDVRHFPSSKKFPWFCREALEKSLKNEGIEYIWLKELGGYRKGGYSSYMETEEYRKGIEKLIRIAGNRTAVLCAELLWWKCHRRFIADTLVSLGKKVVHIYDGKRTEEHEIGKYSDRRVRCDRANR
ncbi:MAG: DUF488 family protein [Candidatus Micrarchaeota archaeon]|nr:DUF488 family protein [Candidatus Micrarchaeota archaeon]